MTLVIGGTQFVACTTFVISSDSIVEDSEIFLISLSSSSSVDLSPDSAPVVIADSTSKYHFVRYSEPRQLWPRSLPEKSGYQKRL